MALLDSEIIPMARQESGKSAGPTANLGFDSNLWPAADKLRIDLHDAMVAIERDNSLTTFPN